MPLHGLPFRPHPPAHDAGPPPLQCAPHECPSEPRARIGTTLRYVVTEALHEVTGNELGTGAPEQQPDQKPVEPRQLVPHPGRSPAIASTWGIRPSDIARITSTDRLSSRAPWGSIR